MAEARTLEARTANGTNVVRLKTDGVRPTTQLFRLPSDMLSLRLLEAKGTAGSRTLTFVEVRNGVDHRQASVREGEEQDWTKVVGNHGHAYRLGVDEQGVYAEVQTPAQKEFGKMPLQIERAQ